MKKLTKFAAVLAVAGAAAVACQKEMTPAAVNDSELEARDCFVASLDQSTKTFIDDSLQVKWSADDSISVNGVVYEISAFLDADSTKAEFTKRYNDVESPKAPFKAYYPVRDFKKDGTLREILMRTNENRFNMPMKAESNTRTMEFQNPYGVLAIKVLQSDAPQGVSMIDVFEGSTGVAAVMYGAPACPVDSLGTVFYIPMAPKTYNNLEVRVVNPTYTDKMFSKDSLSIEIEANTLYAFNFQVSIHSVSLGTDSLKLIFGEDSTLTVTYDPDNVSNKNVIWTSTDESVATVVDGTVTAVSPGSTQVIVESIFGGLKDTCFVTVAMPDSVFLPADYQGWDAATAPKLYNSSIVDGLYEGYADFQIPSENCEFKFCSKPSGECEFGIDSIAIKNETGDYVSVSGNGITNGTITIPSGVYWIKMNLNLKTIQMVQINELNLIGEFCGWNASNEITLSQDPASHSFVSDNDFTISDAQNKTGYKIRFNKHDDWYLGINKSPNGTKYLSLGGDNASMTLAASKYSFTLNCNSNPATAKFTNKDFPASLVLAGDYSGHQWSGTDDVKIYLKDANNGIYKGYVTMMYTESPQTWGFKIVKNGATWTGTSSVASGLQHNLVEGGGENLKPSNGHYYVETDMINMTLNLTALTSVGIIGSFNGWASDAAMTYDQTEMTWSCDQQLNANDDFKFRFNDTWDYTLGTGGEGTNGLIHDGGNITVNEAGTYHITLDMHNTPTFTMLK